MRRVPEIAAWEDARPYLEELRDSVGRDVRPLLDVEGRAPFAICREVFSYVDHLGHLYSGKGDNKVGERFQDYLREVMSVIDPSYGSKRAKQLYLMYRNGPVHQFQPKVLEDDEGNLLKWFCYDGVRNRCPISIPGFEGEVTHLQLIELGDAHLGLPVSTKCLIGDLCSSIDEFAGAVAKDKRVCAWNRAARELNTPRPWPDGSF